MPIIDQLDKDYVIYSLKRGVPRSEIYRREKERLDALGYTEHWTIGVIAHFARQYKAGRLDMQTGVHEFDTYIYGVDPEPLSNALPLFTGHEHIEGDWLVISDLHIPFLDIRWWEKAMITAKEHGLRKALVAGDLLDALPASRYPDLVPKYRKGFEDRQLYTVCDHLGTDFEEVIFMPGNHDRRYIKQSEGTLTFSGLLASFIDGLPNITVTEYDRLYLNSSGTDWLIAHQDGYNKKSGGIAQGLMNKYRMNVIVPHQHHTSPVVDENDFNVGIDIGGLMWIDAIPYPNMTTSTKRKMVNSYAYVKNGEGVLCWDKPLTTERV